jgi:hypothetical protein
VNPTEIIFRLVDRLERSEFAQMLVGSHCSSYNGVPNSRMSADLIVKMTGCPLERALLGFEFKPESADGLARYSVVDPSTSYRLNLFLLSADEHDQSRFARRRHVDFENRRACLPTAEDVIVAKLRSSKASGHASDAQDAKQILSLRSKKLDLPYIRQWADEHGTLRLFNRLLSEVPDAK